MALITGLGLIAVSILTAALSRILAEEMSAWNPSIVRSLIKFAVGRLPEGRRERFQEEWQSHVNEVPGQIGKFLVALGFLFAAYDVTLSDRFTEHNERLVRLLALLDDTHSASEMVLNIIQDDGTLASLEGLSSAMNELRLGLSEAQNFRNQLATMIATASAASRTLVGKLSYTLSARRSVAPCERLSNEAKHTTDRCLEIAKLLEEEEG